MKQNENQGGTSLPPDVYLKAMFVVCLFACLFVNTGFAYISQQNCWHTYAFKWSLTSYSNFTI